MLIGSYHHQLDQKNRFRIPTKFKAFLGENLVVTKGSNKSLYLMTTEAMERNVFDKKSFISPGSGKRNLFEPFSLKKSLER